jgi:hypothetical protein
LEEGHSALDTKVRVRLMGIDTHDMHFVGIVQSERLEHVKSTRCVRAPIVRDEHCLPLGQRRRDSDNRARTLLHDYGEGIVRRVLRFKVKKSVLSKHDEVILLDLQENMRSWDPGILEYLARDICLGTPLGTVLQELLDFVAGIREQGGIMVHFVDASPKRHGLWLADGWGIDNPQPDEHGTRVLRPLDTKFHCSCTVRRTV